MRAGLYERAHVIPGRSLTRSKAIFKRWAGSAYGAVVVDVDGREFIDMLCGLGAISLGYTHPMYGGVCSLPYGSEVYAAEAVLQHVAPWASWVRFTKTGSESTVAARMIAQAVTGRQRVLIGDWAFHGWPWAQHPKADTYALGAMDLDLSDVAAVFVEPHRWRPVYASWLKHLRGQCDRAGALLVFDSMIWGGRWHLGGASGWFNIQPDLETHGKAFGNGQAVAFVVGAGRGYQHGEIVSGTYSGHSAGLDAVLDTLHVYTTNPVIETLWDRGRQLAAGLDTLVALHADLLAAREGAPVHQRLRFHKSDDGERFARLMWDKGVLWHPGAVNVMYSHTPEQIDQVIAAAAESLEAMR